MTSRVPAMAEQVRELGYDGPVTDGALDARLAQAWRQLQAEPSVTGLADRAAADQLLWDVCGDIIAMAVLRVVRNPDGYSEYSEKIDDWQAGGRRADSTEDLYFTAAELRRVQAPAAPTAGSMKYS